MTFAFNNTTALVQAKSCAANETDSQALKIIKTILYCIIMVAAFLGNLFIIIIVYKKKNMRRTTNIFIANMAASDIFIALAVIPRIIVELYIGPRVWVVDGIFGTFLCKFSLTLSDWSVCISITSHAVIAIDRFWAIVYSLRPSPITPARRKYIITFLWLYSILIHSPNFYTYGLYQIRGKTFCLHSWSPLDSKTSDKMYFSVIFIFVICIPVVVMTISYSWLMVSLTIHGKQLAVQTSQVRKQRRKEDIQVLRKVVVLLSVFLLSIFPVTVFGMLSFYVWDNRLPCNAWIFSYIAVLIFISNSAINPCLCIALHESYRSEVRKLLFSRRYPKPVTSPSSSVKTNRRELKTFTSLKRCEIDLENEDETLKPIPISNSPNFLRVLTTTNPSSPLKFSNGLVTP